MRKTKLIISTLVIATGFILGTSLSPTTNAYADNHNRKICRHCTGQCVTAAFESQCNSCTAIPELCTDD